MNDSSRKARPDNDAREWASRCILVQSSETKHPRDVLMFIRGELEMHDNGDANYRDAVWAAREREMAARNQERGLSYMLKLVKRDGLAALNQSRSAA